MMSEAGPSDAEPSSKEVRSTRIVEKTRKCFGVKAFQKHSAKAALERIGYAEVSNDIREAILARQAGLKFSQFQPARIRPGSFRKEAQAEGWARPCH